MCSRQPNRRKVSTSRIGLISPSKPKPKPKTINNLPLIKKTTICKDVKPGSMDHIDDRTKIIVSTYLDEIQENLLSIHGNDTYYIIPKEILAYCLELVDDYFMINTGTFEWIIDGELFVQLLATANRQKMQSKIFYVGNVPWRLELYPNGNSTSNTGDFKLYLRNLDMPSTWSYIYTRNVYKVKELMAQSTNIQSMQFCHILLLEIGFLTMYIRYIQVVID